VSALAHYIEREGIATTIVALVREHCERIRPPRTLFVPYELGRPMGSPNDTALQHRVLAGALALFDAPRPLIVDFEASDPDRAGVDGWAPPVDLPPLADGLDDTALADALRAEAAAVWPSYLATVEAQGRTSVGIGPVAPDDIVGFLCRSLTDGVPSEPADDFRPQYLLRFACDDLKAVYSETILGAPPYPSSRQVADWFWTKTAASLVMRRLKRRCLDHPGRGYQFVGRMFIMPAYMARQLGD